MRRISLHMFITFDGYAYFPTYPGSNDPLSDEVDPDSYEMWVKHFPSLDTIILGRISYEAWAAFWPKKKESDHPFYHAFANFVDDTNKIVISNTLKTATWNHSKIMSGSVDDIVHKLRGEPGKNIAIGGGPTLAQAFMNRGLIDDYYLTVFPVILGTTTKDALMIINKIQNQQTLALRTVKPMKYGELFLHYETVR